MNDLFREPNIEKTDWRHGGYFGQTDRPLMIKSGADLKKLSETLVAQPASTLQVDLEDRYLTGWSRVPGFRSATYKQTCVIEVSLPVCDERTKLIYDRVSSVTHEQMRMEGETTARLEVNDAFYKLLNDDLEAYLQNLTSQKDSRPCEKIELKKFLEAKETAGFESRGYQLNEGQKSFLDRLAIAMLNEARNWSSYQLDVKIVGFGDRNKVGEQIDLYASESGIDQAVWDNTPNPLTVYQNGCKNDWVKERRFFDFSSRAQTKPIQDINNNCELGAVRAYVATAYLRSQLGTNSVSYSYATGGIVRKTGIVNPADRRIVVEFTLKGARKGKP